jgi:hypothetical protein
MNNNIVVFFNTASSLFAELRSLIRGVGASVMIFTVPEV